MENVKNLEKAKEKAKTDIMYLEFQIGKLNEQIKVKKQIITNANYYISKAQGKDSESLCEM